MLLKKSKMQIQEERAILVKKIGSALFFASSSLMITIVNKTVLTTYRFPSYQVLGLGQILVTIVVLWCGRLARLVQFPSLDSSVICKIWPLPVIYLGNMVTGLDGTKELSLPMFTALRRFSILMTMVGERVVLDVKAPWLVHVTVWLMIVGAVIAAADDLKFSRTGYNMVLLNDAFTAANVVYMKKKLNSKEFCKVGIMFYNALFMLVPASLIVLVFGELKLAVAYEHWDDVFFLIQFVTSCLLGIVLYFSTMLCTQYNSALTTGIIGCLKNILLTYLGMFIGGDYIFSWLNFVGLNVSVLGSVLYTYISFRSKPLSGHMFVNEDDVKSENDS